MPALASLAAIAVAREFCCKSLNKKKTCAWHASCYLLGVDKTDVNRKPMRKTGVAVLVCLLVGPPAFAEQGPRLKFRGKGTACTCASGTSEAEISKAWEKRFTQSNDAPLDRLDGRSATGDKQRRTTDESGE